MSESDGKRRKRYVYHTEDKSRHTCLNNGPGYSSEKCTVLGKIGSQYSKSRPTKDRRHDLKTRDKFNRQEENNFIVNNAADEIILQENNKVSAEAKSHQNI